MANQEKKRTDARQDAARRTRVRVIAADRSGAGQKQRERLARQEQKLAEQWERDERRQAEKERRAPAPKQGKKPRGERLASLFRRQPARNTAVESGERPTGNTLRRAKEEFEIILGGKGKKIVRWVGVAIALVIVLIIVNALIPVGLLEYAETVFAGAGSGDGFPVAVSASNRSMIRWVGSDVALLTDSAVAQYKSNGKLLYERQHGYNDPAFATCSARVLVYDRGGTGLRMENRARTLFSLEADGPITTADLAENGSFAVVTRGGNYVSDATAYSPSGERQFVWHSATRQITATALSGDGRYMAVCTLSVEGGEAVTHVMLLDTHRETEPALFEERYEGCVPVSLAYKGSRVVVLFADRVSSISQSGERQDYPFEGGTLTCFDNTQSFGTVAVLERFGDARNHHLLVLDQNAEPMGEADLNAAAVAVSARSDRVAVLTEGSVGFYSRRGESRGEQPLAADARTLLCRGDSAVLLGSGLLSEIHA